MRALEQINEVNWGKHIIFLLIFISIAGLFAFFYLLPIIERYKIQVVEFKRSENLDSQIAKNIANLEQNRDLLLDKNMAVFKHLRNEIDLNNFKNELKKYLDSVKITKLEQVYDKDSIVISNIKISGILRKIGDIKALFDFITSLNQSSRISFPIELKKQNSALKIEFIMQIYNSKYNLNNELDSMNPAPKASMQKNTSDVTLDIAPNEEKK